MTRGQGEPVRTVSLVPVAEIRPVADEVVAAFTADWSASLGSSEIHHIGATSLPFGHTKGDVDVNVRVAEGEFQRVVDALSARVAVAQPENWTATFASFSADGYRLPLGVQVTVLGSPDDFLLDARNRLRADAELLRRYDDAKLESAVGGREEYWQAKNRFHTELLGH